MILPGSYIFSLILLVLSMICLGSWANTLKLTAPKWRFEFYCYDFALGAFLAAIAIGFTFGTLGLDGFTVIDDLSLSGKRQDAFALMAGSIFTLGNMLFIGAISLAGMAIAIPVCLGSAMIFGVILSHFISPAGNGVLLTLGCAAVFGGIAFGAVAFKKQMQLKAAEAAAAAAAAVALAAEQAALQNKPLPPKPKKIRKKQPTVKAMILAVVGGLLLAGSSPVVDMSRQGENGLGPYSAAFLFAAAVFFSTVVYNLFFMNLPVQGAALSFSQYTIGMPKDHLVGVIGGGVWFCGFVIALVVARAEGSAEVGPALRFCLAQGAILVGAAWGLYIWQEFKGAESSIKLYLGVMLVLLVLGIGAASTAPLF